MMEAIWYGNATVKYKIGDATLVTDPFITRNPELPALLPEDLADADAILITHGHFDHVADLQVFHDTLACTIYAPKKVAANLERRLSLDEDRLKTIATGETVDIKGTSIEILPAAHVSFDAHLIFNTLSHILFDPIPKKWAMLKKNMSDHRRFPEEESVAWIARKDGRSLMHLGSLGLKKKISYPEVDVVCLPYQGSTYLHRIANRIVARVNPKTVFLHHFDDAFPPISQHVSTDQFEAIMAKEHAERRLLKPDYRTSLSLVE